MKVGDLVRYKRTGRLHVIIDRFAWPARVPMRTMFRLLGFPTTCVISSTEVEIVREAN